MKVQDLINNLQKYNPESEIIFSCSIESGRSSSHVGYGDVSISHEDVYEYQFVDFDGNEETQEATDVVVLSVWGEESNWD